MAMLNNQRVILQLKSCLGNVFTNSCKIGKRHQNSPKKELSSFSPLGRQSMAPKFDRDVVWITIWYPHVHNLHNLHLNGCDHFLIMIFPMDIPIWFQYNLNDISVIYLVVNRHTLLQSIVSFLSPWYSNPWFHIHWWVQWYANIIPMMSLLVDGNSQAFLLPLR